MPVYNLIARNTEGTTILRPSVAWLATDLNHKLVLEETF